MSDARTLRSVDARPYRKAGAYRFRGPGGQALCVAACRLWRSAGALALAVLLTGHVGTDDVFYAGRAGPWNVRVSVRQPGVIPGLADISVRVAEPGVERVLVTARFTREGGGEAPPPDEAERVRGADDLWAAQLWLMVRGSHEIVVIVEGAAGQGTAHIPMVATATKQLAMTRGLGLFILGGGLFLVLGLLTIVGAASGESVLPPGAVPSVADRRRALRSMALAAVVLALVLFGGWRWVEAESEGHRARLDRPWASEATLRDGAGTRVLELTITEPVWVDATNERRRTRDNRPRSADLIPDHGKLMHMFLVRDGDMDAFAHLHPERVDDNRFAVPFPPLPGGTYRVYADITHEDGFSHTLVTSFTAGPPTAEPGTGPSAGSPDYTPASLLDPDDAWWSAQASLGSPVGAGDAAPGGPASADPAAAARTRGAATSRLADGSIMRWLNAGEPLVAGQDADLVFRVEDAAGDAVAPEPYMGMQGHAMLNRADGGVFVHLHPSGMISLAAQSALGASSGAADGISGTHAGMDMADPAVRMLEGDGSIRFPLVVPDAGRYRIWVQVRRGGHVLTGSFDTEVVAAEP